MSAIPIRDVATGNRASSCIPTLFERLFAPARQLTEIRRIMTIGHFSGFGRNIRTTPMERILPILKLE